MRRAITRAACVLLPLLASRAVAQRQPAADSVRVRGVVFDSLARAPLAGARVQFVREDGEAGIATATSGANGAFAVRLSPGVWIAGFTHPRLDSLMIDLPAQRVTVVKGMRRGIGLAIPSSRTLLTVLCGAQAEDSAGVLQGFVLRAPTQAALDSGGVYVQWTELQIAGAGLERGVPTVRAQVRSDGSYRACGTPANTEAVVWAQRGAASTGLVGVMVPTFGIARLDLVLDPAATREIAVPRDSATVEDTTALLPGERLRPLPRAGPARFRGVVRDEGGRALGSARARIVDRRPVATNDAGAFVLDSLARGSQTLLVRALGYAPVSRLVTVTDEALPDTIILTSIKAMLDTVRVTSERVYDAAATRFESIRRSSVTGRFIGRAEIDRRRPYEFTNLLQSLPGVRVTYIRWQVAVTMRAMTGAQCAPAIFIDGFEQRLDYASDLNFLVQPDEVVGVAVFNTAAMTPMAFRGSGGLGCGSIVIWTRSSPATP